MLDYRTRTFLTLCTEMNYRRTAEKLNMTQPGVTQHIHLLEGEYGCTLFSYDGRALKLTEQGKLLRDHLLRAQYDDNWIRQRLSAAQVPTLHIGATKSIGDYMIAPQLSALLHSGVFTVDLSVDNTQSLLDRLGQGNLDFAMIEGEFDKSAWGFQKMWAEPFVGICSREHPLAGKTISVERLFSLHLLLREAGSGTRAIFEDSLSALGYGLSAFEKVNHIGSVHVLRELIAQGDAISFGYRSVMAEDPRLACFSVEGFPASHDLYYVYRKNTHAQELLQQYMDIVK